MKKETIGSSQLKSVTPEHSSLSRRQLLTGITAVAAASVAAPVLASPISLSLNLSSVGEANHPASKNTAQFVTGKLVSKVDTSVQSLILRNDNAQSVVINEFVRSVLMVDGGVIDCNAACNSGPITLAAHQEILLQFDRSLQDQSSESIGAYQNTQSVVRRLSEGTRVIPFVAVVSNGRATVKLAVQPVVS